MKRYKRGYVDTGAKNIYQMNLYKNDDGLVFISFEGEWKQVIERDFWTFPTIMKCIKDLKKGDVIKTEFGVYDNIVTVRLLEDIKFVNGWAEYFVEYINRPDCKPFKMFGFETTQKIEVL